MLNPLERVLIDESAKPTRLPLSLLDEITKQFSVDLQIGSGGFAVVYKGHLGNGGTVAVKKLSNTIHMDDDKFIKEVNCLMKIRHKNIVRFLGYCLNTHGEMINHEEKLVMADVRHMLLCFEYLSRGSLCGYISDASSGLDWRNRYQILKGICEGLCYLHEERVAHLDLKPGNILLDDDMVPKISDFGLSRQFDVDQTRAVTSTVIGSMGYMAPEFCSGMITWKSDIFSLGVIFTEMLTGRRGHCLDDNGRKIYIEDPHWKQWVIESWKKRLDESSADILLEQVRVCTEISIECMSISPEKRPDIRSIINKLTSTERTNDCMDSGMTTSSMAKVRSQLQLI